MVEIRLQNVGKAFPGNPRKRDVLANIGITIGKGEVVAVRGDNGCGKTTLLNLVAGLDSPTEGTITFGQGGVEKPRLGFAQQDYTSSLLPWFNVIENVALPLRLRGLAREEREPKARELLQRLGFSSLAELGYPHQLSGGQKQRVAISRALINEPDLVILDEPFANLDAHTTRDLQNTLASYHDASRPTMLLVSHEIAHCVFLADRVIVLHGSPAGVALEVRVDLPRPRRRQVMFSDEYARIRSRILEAEEALYAKG